jgi:hypothetical protein
MTSFPGESSQAHQSEAWERLYKNQRPVGFKKNIGSTEFFSKDGYGWSGEQIPYTHSRRQIPIRIFTQRVFHGDVIQMPPFSGAQECTEQVVLLSDCDTVYTYDPTTDRLHPLEERFPPPSVPWARKLVGPLEGASTLFTQLESKLKRTQPTRIEYAWDIALLSLSIVTGFLFSAGIQWRGLGSIGPVMTFLGAVVGGIGFWAVLRKHDWHRLSRKAMLKMGAHCGLLLLVIGCGLAHATLSGLLGTQPQEATNAYYVAYGGLGFFCGLISTWMGGELVAWRTGGFSDEQQQDLGFRHYG